MAAFGKDGPDVLAMGQQFWNAWTDLAQGVAQGKAPDWSDPMQAFSKAAGPLGGEAAHAVDALAEQGQRYMAFLQSAASRLGMQDPMQAPDLAQLWRHNMAEGNPVLDALRATVSEGARGFEQLAQDVRPMLEQARSEWMKSLSTPTFGYSREQQERVMGYIKSGRDEGASVVAGGESPSHPGFYVKPTVMADVNRSMRVVLEEIFGPVLVAQGVDDLDEVAALANDTPYGVSARLWSTDLNAVHRLVPKVRAGTVWVNTYNQYDSASPFGGYRQSGFGRDLGYEAALEKYTQVKSVWVALDR